MEQAVNFTLILYNSLNFKVILLIDLLISMDTSKTPGKREINLKKNFVPLVCFVVKKDSGIEKLMDMK